MQERYNEIVLSKGKMAEKRAEWGKNSVENCYSW